MINEGVARGVGRVKCGCVETMMRCDAKRIHVGVAKVETAHDWKNVFFHDLQEALMKNIQHVYIGKNPRDRNVCRSRRKKHADSTHDEHSASSWNRNHIVSHLEVYFIATLLRDSKFRFLGIIVIAVYRNNIIEPSQGFLDTRHSTLDTHE
jgi:hypothetical protein